MDQTINRRNFIVRTATIGASLTFGGVLDRFGNAIAGTMAPDLAVVEGANYYDAARKAVDTLGGMKRFVSKGSRVGLLVNSVFDKPGTYAKPQIALAVIAMCHEAGAKEIVSLEDAPGSYWRRATMSKAEKEMVESVKDPGDTTTVELPKGVNLKKAEIVRDFLECDVLINIPIFKDHEGTRFTGVLKNIMGATNRNTNDFFHSGSGTGGGYKDASFLSQCIADAHLMRKQTLCVGDGTEMIVTNGPFGPGRVVKPRTIVAGTDGVAIDSYGATLLGLHPGEIAMIRMAEEHGLGTSKLESLTITRIVL